MHYGTLTDHSRVSIPKFTTINNLDWHIPPPFQKLSLAAFGFFCRANEH